MLNHPPLRSADGRFAQGDLYLTQWPKIPYRDHVPIEAWLAILDQANELVTVAVEGRRTTRMTRLEANLIELASGPRTKSRHLTDFVRLSIWAAHYIEKSDAVEQRRQLDERDMAILRASFMSNTPVDWRGTLRRWAQRQVIDQSDYAVARGIARNRRTDHRT